MLERLLQNLRHSEWQQQSFEYHEQQAKHLRADKNGFRDTREEEMRINPV